MDQRDLGLTRYDAGGEYLEAPRALGLEPEALFWTFDSVVDHFVLVLVTRMFDFAGPLELSKLLFKAYDAAATPREIDPFIVRMHSPFQHIYRQLELYLGNRVGHASLEPREFDRAVMAGEIEPFAVAAFRYDGVEGFSSWVYKYTATPKKIVDAERLWKRFSRNVERVAA